MTDLRLHVPPGSEQALTLPPGTKRPSIYSPDEDPLAFQISLIVDRAPTVTEAVAVLKGALDNDRDARVAHYPCRCPWTTADLLAGRPVLTPEQEAAKALPPKPGPSRRRRRARR